MIAVAARLVIDSTQRPAYHGRDCLPIVLPLMRCGNPRTVLFMNENDTDIEALDHEMRNIIEEARVILPGLQALFGFQTIVVFNERFVAMPEYSKDSHLIGLGMIIIAIALAMSPAAYYRCIGRERLSYGIVKHSSRMIRGALAPLACGLGLDMFTVIFAATGRQGLGVGGAVTTFALLICMWFLLPLQVRRRTGRRTRNVAM